VCQPRSNRRRNTSKKPDPFDEILSRSNFRTSKAKHSGNDSSTNDNTSLTDAGPAGVLFDITECGTSQCRLHSRRRSRLERHHVVWHYKVVPDAEYRTTGRARNDVFPGIRGQSVVFADAVEHFDRTESGQNGVNHAILSPATHRPAGDRGQQGRRQRQGGSRGWGHSVKH